MIKGLPPSHYLSGTSVLDLADMEIHIHIQVLPMTQVDIKLYLYP